MVQSLSQRVSILIFTLISTSIINSIIVSASDDLLKATIEKAASARIESLNTNNPNILDDFYIPGAQLATHEKDRWKAWRNVEKKLRGTINLFKLDSLDIMPPVINGDTASVKMYEFMKFTWTDENGKKIDSAIGIPHEIQATLMNGKWIISNDAYDEGPLSDVRINKYDRINDPAPKNVSQQRSIKCFQC